MGLESKITSKGQTTIPVDVREYLGLKDGDRLSYYFENGEVRLAKKRSALDFAGVLHDPARKTVSVEEMDEVISDALKKENF